MTKEIYIFSGLGVDERIFQRLDFSDFKVTFIEWIVPQGNETIEQYATRLIEQISTLKPILIGLSFGGIMAIEVAKQIDIEKVIVISAVKTRKELPPYYRLAGNLKIHKLVPTRLFKRSNFFTYWLFDAKSQFDKKLLKQILYDTNPIFIKWAIDKVVCWRNQTIVENIFHIHGVRDWILPLRYVTCDKIIKSGGHLMTLNRAEEMNDVLHEQLN